MLGAGSAPLGNGDHEQHHNQQHQTDDHCLAQHLAVAPALEIGLPTLFGVGNSGGQGALLITSSAKPYFSEI